MTAIKQKQQTYTIYANCQTSLIQAHLNLSEEFRQKYKYEELPRNYVAIQKELEIPEDIVNRTKLLIYQPIDNKYETRSSDYIKNKVSSDCICISFPYIYFQGYWPENTKNPINEKNQQYPFGKFPYGDSNIIEMIAKDYNETKILAELEREDFYQTNYIFKNFQQTLSELIKRETETDLKISKFIKDNYRYTYLFHSPNHPANIIGLNLANQILEKLEIAPISSIYLQEKFADYQLPIYPSVIKILDLKFTQQETRYTVTFTDAKINFKNYMKEYLKQYSQKTRNNMINILDNKIHQTASSIAWISLPRTGTNYLCDLLQNHHRIESHYEIFHKLKFYGQNRNRVISCINKKYSTSFSNYKDTKLIKWIHSNPQELLTVLKDLSKENYFSFKIFPGQLNQNLVKEAIIDDKSIKKILVKRNLLDVYVSREFALKLGKWGNINTSTMKLEINFEEFTKWFNWVDRWYKLFEEGLTNTGQSYSVLNYKVLHSQSTDRDKFIYLIELLKTVDINLDLSEEVIANIQNTISVKKQDKRTNIADKIANYLEFEREIYNSGLEYLLVN